MNKSTNLPSVSEFGAQTNKLNRKITSITATIYSIQDMNGDVEPALKRLNEIIALARHK